MIPPATSVHSGERALKLAEDVAGLELIPWQEGAVIDVLATNRNQWAANTAGLIVARQNGKGGVLEVIALAALLLFGERRILWSAHTQKVATDAFERMSAIFEDSPELKKRLATGRAHGLSKGKGDQKITLRTGQHIFFFTRSPTAGRGLPADRLILDEALDITSKEMNNLRFTVRTSATRTGRRAQTIFVSTPPDELEHPNGLILAKTRKTALAGTAKHTAWLEWSVPEKTAATDVAAWPRGNPSLGFLFDLEVIEGDLENATSHRDFLVEGMAAPDFWPDPDAAADADELAVPETFFDAGKHGTTAGDQLVIAIDVSPSRRTSVSVASWLPDGRKHVETIVDHPGTGWVVDVVLAIIGEQDPAALIMDEYVAGLIGPRLRAAGIEPETTGRAAMGQASQGFVDDVTEDQIRWVEGDQPLADAAKIATWRSLGVDGQAFNRKGKAGHINALVSAALASWGLEMFAARVQKPPPAEPLPLATTAASTSTGPPRTSGGLQDFSRRF